MSNPLPFAEHAPVFVGIGGSGVIGSALKRELEGLGVGYISISLDPDEQGLNYRNIQLDMNQTGQAGIAERLVELGKSLRVIGILDIIGLRGSPAREIVALAMQHDARIGIISSCLLYDHDHSTRVDETCPTIKHNGAKHHYLTRKLDVEQVWRESEYSNWLLLRAHHIVGKGSLLGCIPNHNRDRQLLSTLKSGKPLALCRGGDVRLSFIHPDDLAHAAFRLITSGNLASETVILANPEPVRALDYYREICRQLNCGFPGVLPFSADQSDFWSVTGKDNIYFSKFDAVRDIECRHGIEDCIKDAVAVGEEKYPFLGEHLRKRISS